MATVMPLFVFQRIACIIKHNKQNNTEQNQLKQNKGDIIGLQQKIVK